MFRDLRVRPAQPLPLQEKQLVPWRLLHQERRLVARQLQLEPLLEEPRPVEVPPQLALETKVVCRLVREVRHVESPPPLRVP